MALVRERLRSAWCRRPCTARHRPFRHTTGEFERSLIELQLDHQDSSVRAIYDRDDCMPERVDLMQFWADRVDEYRSGKETMSAVA